MSVRAALGLWVALVLLLPPSLVATTPTAAATGDTRTLYFYHTHTRQSARFTYMVNGQYDQKVLQQMNIFLADWRTHSPTKMDPALFDVLWRIYQKVGASAPINIVSSYREPKTNAMLRAKSKAVAENSQHMKGKAMDIFIPGVPLPKLRAAAMSFNVGGVGYYPTSGSPFVHVDTGSVRAWPRMTRAQLEKVFPDGKTLHLPVDGKPLSTDGRRYAEAEWNKCHMVPCSGQPSYIEPTVPTGDPGVMVASTAPVPATPSPDLFSTLFAGGQPANPVGAEPTQRMVATVAVSAPVPMTRSASAPMTVVPPVIAATGELAPIPASKSAAVRLATAPSISRGAGETALVALAHLGGEPPVPQPRVLMTPKAGTSPDDMMVTAYVPAIRQDPGAQRALQMIIERETTAALPAKALPKTAVAPAPIRQASLGQQPKGGLDALANLLQDTWNAVTGSGQPTLQSALAAHVSPPPNAAFAAHEVELSAPDIDHVAETMTQPVAMSDVFYGEMYEPEGYLEKTTELGPLVTRMGIETNPEIPGYDSFTIAPPQLVASN
jgi:uncharacterized protein YcbK (DUF882 family)